MKIGVYDRYWSTGGGAERVAAAFAAALTERGEVSLIGHEPIDIAWLEGRFEVDLAGVGAIVLPDRGGALTRASSDLDLLVNASFMSHEPSGARHGLYYVHFPTSLEGPINPVKSALRRLVSRMRQAPEIGMRWGEGFHHRDTGSRAPMWADGRGSIFFDAAEGTSFTIRLVFSHHRAPETLPVEVRVRVDGEMAARFELDRPTDPVRRRMGRPVEVEVVGRKGMNELTIESDTFVPADLDEGSDRRTLGVPLSSVTLSMGSLDLLARFAPSLFYPPVSAQFLRSYDVTVANSAYTSQWVERYWRSDAGVLHPPVAQFEPGEKKPLILSVGRFFPQEMGHSKCQLEMVEAFRAMHQDPALRGWRLVLSGGSDESASSYLDEVRSAAAGLPIDICPDVPYSQLVDLYATASVYWHAAGLGVDARQHPDRLEHFGISTAEAMSAGAVPVVIDLAGQREIVQHGVDGYRFRTLEDLVALTRHLLLTDGQLERMSASARRRAEYFSPGAFEEQVLALVDGMGR